MSTDPQALAFQAGRDPQAFAELYDRYYERVLRYACYRCDDIHTAEDLTAQVFERLLLRIHTFDPKRGEFEPWLFAVARNLLKDHYHSQQLRRWLPWEAFHRHPAADILPEESVIQRQADAELSQALAGLQERERDLLALKFGSRFTNRQIAAVTGLKESNVGVILYRALEHLRAVLEASKKELHLQEVNHD